MNKIKGFLWFYFFTSLICISALLMFNSQKSSTISDLKDVNQNLEYKNTYLSERLSQTKDSLKYATSEDVLWLSRILYTETGKPLEMYYIAHVVKNRVETCYNGECSYKRVALDPYEFSAFNPDRELRWYYAKMNRDNVYNPGKWAAAKQVALDVYMSPYDPTQGGTHFFSQVGMPNGEFPHWAYHGEEIELSTVSEKRLRIYKNVD